MKKLILITTLALSIMSCKDDATTPTPTTTVSPATIEGRWVSEGFETSIRYDFSSDLRYTTYSDDGRFSTLEETLADSSFAPPHSWTYSGDTVVIDLNFGNYSRLVPVFKCDNKVIDWIAEDGSLHSTYFREGHDLAVCR